MATLASGPAAGPRLQIDGRSMLARPGASLLDCAGALGLRVPTRCLEQGTCGECLLEVEAGAELLTPPGPAESHVEGGFRLACRARIAAGHGELRCRTPRRGAIRILSQARSGVIQDSAAWDPAVTRDRGSVLIDGVAVARSMWPIHGLALDLGTTTVALRLYDLESGSLTATQCFENPQRFGGSDVMARIRYDRDHAGQLQRTLIASLARAIGALPCDPASIYELVVAGNPTMRDLFFGLDVDAIGQAPYCSQTETALRAGRRTTTALCAPARQLHLPLHPAARVYGLPLVASLVGADAAAGVLTTGLLSRDEITVVLDIGTNTELVIGNRRRALATSCPAGPAFEGGGGCGMPALEGAVERVHLRDDGSALLRVIGGVAPRGICGSGLIDLLSELLRTRRIDPAGRLADGQSRFVVDAEHGLELRESDLAELAQAKAAIAAGLRIVLDTYGVGPGAIASCFLAGGFARHLDIAAAIRIGLLPDLPLDRFVQVGNAALEGAAIALRSVSRRQALEAEVQRIEHVRLETHPRFFDHFVDGCQFAVLEAGV